MPAGRSSTQIRQRVAVDIISVRPQDDGRIAWELLASGWLRHGDSPDQALVRTLVAGGMISERAYAAASAMDLGAVSSAVHDLGDGLRVHRLGLQFPLLDGSIAEELRRAGGSSQPIADLAEVAGRVGPRDSRSSSPHAGHDPDDGPLRIQRAACYAVVREPGRVLLTRLRHSELWALPGGGIDIGEHPDHALAREVFEESGFRLTDVRLAGVGTAQWTGRAPDGALEDFHAVHLLYTGNAPTDVPPRVVEEDGSTEEVAWVEVGDLAKLRLTTAAVSGFALVGVLPT